MNESASATDNEPAGRVGGDLRGEGQQPPRGAKLQPLLALKPYLLRYKPAMIFAAIALLVAASATLASSAVSAAMRFAWRVSASDQ